MGKFTTNRWIDFGDFGQHKAIVSGTTGDFGHVDSVEVEFKGETLQLVRLLPTEYEQIILEEEAINESAYFREQSEDRKFDAMREAA